MTGSAPVTSARARYRAFARGLLVVVLCTPFGAWALYKPVRLLAPGLVPGVSCVSAEICLDDVSRHSQALRLYGQALQFVDASVGTIRNGPRVVFCSTVACSRSFGVGTASARTLGRSGIVIGPRAWTRYYVRHEMIHHLQAERLDVLAQWRSPAWFKEGMAYLLSGDPRADLGEPLQRYRAEFAHWYRGLGEDEPWRAAGRL